MAESQTSPKKSLTRGKAILIGVLAVVLVAILYIQFGGKSEKPVGEAVEYRPPRPAIAVQPASATTKSVTLATAKGPTNGQANKDKNAVAAAIIDEAQWKSPNLETVVAFDPFALPTSFPQPPKLRAGSKSSGAEGLIAAVAADDAKKLAEAVEKLHLEMEELKQRGVQVITREGGQYVAVIGEHLLRVGDKINEFTVTAIDPDGYVHIEKKESP